MTTLEELKKLAAILSPSEVEAVKRLKWWQEVSWSDRIHHAELTRQFIKAMKAPPAETIARLENHGVLLRKPGGNQWLRWNEDRNLAEFTLFRGVNGSQEDAEFDITSRLVTLLDLLRGEPQHDNANPEIGSGAAAKKRQRIKRVRELCKAQSLAGQWARLRDVANSDPEIVAMNLPPLTDENVRKMFPTRKSGKTSGKTKRKIPRQ